ncbi:hypothetical protein [Enterococcus faecalis]|uniref:hypothetical protein n=1 Tax=Enterococcus TaxID=1350 RepID=UPI001AD7369A|nr:hypothetical protein [Enterococcus faecalis]EME5442839.1 hypothetical protein [Enterococcus faecalis]QTI53002.1 hypothetical protein H8446_01695 [Enterococcus faecalis]
MEVTEETYEKIKISELKNEVEFLKSLLEINSASLDKALETNRVLIEELKKRV